MKIKIGEVENKIPDTSSLVTIIVLTTKFGEVDYKIRDYVKYITTQESIAENFRARSKQPNRVNKTDFANKLISFNRKITSNKTKYFEAQKKLKSLTTKDHNFFLRQNLFYNDGSQNTFVDQLTPDTLE